RVFESGAERHCRDIRAGDPADRGIQAGEATLSELSRNLGAESSGPVGLVDHGDATSLFDRADAGLDVPGAKRAQVDDLYLDAVLTQPGSGLHRDRPHVA